MGLSGGSLERGGPIPAWRQLAELVARDIRDRRRPGDRVPSQNELARKHGVSVETVLKSLGDLERRGLIRRERGRGTFVAPAARGGGPVSKTVAIGVVISESWDRAEIDPFYQEMISRLAQAAGRAGHPLTILAPETLRPARLPDFIRERSVAGLILFNRPEIPAPVFRALREAFPLVVTDPPAAGEDAGAPWVDVDSQAGARLAVERLIRDGHRDIGLLNGDPTRRPAFADRAAAYRACLAARGLRPRRGLVRQSADLSVAAARREAEVLLAARPTAIFCANGRLTLGALQAAARARLRIPDDLSVVGYDDAPVFDLTPPGITMVRQPVAEFARLLVSRLEGLLRGGGPVPRGARLQPALVERASVAPPRKT